MEKSVLQQAIETIERKLNGYWDGVNSYGIGVMSGLQISKAILESLLPDERAILEKALFDAWNMAKRHEIVGPPNYPDKQTFMDNYLK